MKLYYGELDLGTLGVLQILGEQTSKDADLSQREKKTVRCRLDFFREGYLANRSQVNAVRAALKSGSELLRWEDETGATYMQVYPSVGDDDQPEEANAQGTYQQAVVFSFWFYKSDTTGAFLTATYRRNGVGPRTVNLGQVVKVSDKYGSTLMDEMHIQRRHGGGTVSLSGRWALDASVPLEVRRREAITQQKLLKSEIKKSPTGVLSYGRGSLVALEETIKVSEFEAEIDQAVWAVEWKLAGVYTNFPNEANFALSEFTVSPTENREDGSAGLSLAGSIAAPSSAVALAKLAALRALYIPAGYVCIKTKVDEARFEVKSTVDGREAGDGEAYHKLTFSEEYLKQSGSIVKWDLKIQTQEAVATGLTRITYSGSVQASGQNLNQAYAAGKAQADALGAGKYPMMMNSNVSRVDRLFQTAAPYFVTVEFSYEYETRGVWLYMQYAARHQREFFGEETIAVSGGIEAPDQLAADVAFDGIKSLGVFAGLLMVSESYPKLSKQVLNRGSGANELHGRYEFSAVFHKGKAAAEITMQTDVEVDTDVLGMQQRTVVSGVVFCSAAVEGEEAVGKYLKSLGLTGNKIQFRRKSPARSGFDGAGNPVSVLMSLEFAETYVSRLTLESGVLECEVTEELLYGRNQLVVRPVLGGTAIIQGADGSLGKTCGSRTVSGRVTAASENLADAYVAQCVKGLIAAQGNMTPPRVSTGFKFLPRAQGIARGAEADVLVYTKTFTFAEWVPTLQWIDA